MGNSQHKLALTITVASQHAFLAYFPKNVVILKVYEVFTWCWPWPSIWGPQGVYRSVNIPAGPLEFS